jgi:hypothetical protein
VLTAVVAHVKFLAFDVWLKHADFDHLFSLLYWCNYGAGGGSKSPVIHDTAGTQMEIRDTF